MCRLSTLLVRISANFTLAIAAIVFGILGIVSPASSQCGVVNCVQSTYQVNPNTGQNPVTTQSQNPITNNLATTVTDQYGNLVGAGITQDGTYGTLKASAQSFISTPTIPPQTATSSYSESYIAFDDFLTLSSANPVTIPNGTPAQVNLTALLQGSLTAFGTLPQETGNNDYAYAKVSSGFTVPYCSGPCSLSPGTTSLTIKVTSGGGLPVEQFFGTNLFAEVGETFEFKGSLDVIAFANTFGGSASSTYPSSNSSGSFADTASFTVQVDTPGVFFTSESGATYSGPATPIPATLPLFATGLGGLGLLGWRRKWKAQATA
jgi:hypothetical protein